MLKFNNAHIFTGYLKQKLSTTNIPSCKIYSKEFADYFMRTGKEDPRVIESLDTVIYNTNSKQFAVRINYLRDNEVYNYFNDHGLGINSKHGWSRANMLYYDVSKNIPGLTKTLHSPGPRYDRVTHEYLGEYLRYLRDYHDINLMSLYNCFSDTPCNNLLFNFTYKSKTVEFSSYDPKYRIYAFPVKLFSNYTIAIDSPHGVEIFCGLYNTHLYNPHTLNTYDKDKQLGVKTYVKVGRASFNQPFLFDKLDVSNWPVKDEIKTVGDNTNITNQLDTSKISRVEIAAKEQDLKMFIKVPASCKSSIVVLEGDYRTHNNARFLLNNTKNLEMFGCSVGDQVTVKGVRRDPETDEIEEGKKSDTVKDVKLSRWRFGYKQSVESLESEYAGNYNVVIPTIFPPSSENQDIEIWTQDVYTVPKYDDTNGGCCLIQSVSDLAYVIANNGKVQVTHDGKTFYVNRFRLTTDLFINDPYKVKWETGEAEEGYVIRRWFDDGRVEKVNGFSGIIDGDGHTIFGLYAENLTDDRASVGLIPTVDADANTTLKNIGINCAYLRGTFANPFVADTSKSNLGNVWSYKQNHSVVNYRCRCEKCKGAVITDMAGFKPIGKLQLLEFNTGESYPFADRLIEYLSDSAITPIDEIPDNIRRAQQVMINNGNYFRISGLWEGKMQKVIYDYLMNDGHNVPNASAGYQPDLGHVSKSMVYDILGYVDKDAEKWYASRKLLKDGKTIVTDTIKNVDIYDALYDV